MDGIFKEGDMVKVKLIGIDQKTGKFKLSRKALMPRPERTEQREQRPPREDRNYNERREQRNNEASDTAPSAE